MIPVPKYQIGQTVFNGFGTITTENIPCPECCGETEVTVTTPAGATYKAPCVVCERGYYSDGFIKKIAPCSEVRSLTIGSIRIDTNEKEEERISYMCIETGVGTGSIYYEPKLHLTFELAEQDAVFMAQELTERIRRGNAESVASKKKRGRKLPLMTCPKCQGRGEILREKV
jgi:hypothetical protein